MKVQQIVLRIYTSLYKRIHSWGIFILLGLLFATSTALKLPMAMKLFSRIGLMSVHVFSGFSLLLIFILLAYNYLLGLPNNGKQDTEDDDFSTLPSGNQRLINSVYYAFLFVLCSLGLVYYFVRSFSINGSFFNQNLISLSHVIVGWFFLSIFFVKFYLTIIQWIEEVFSYLREY